MYSINKCLSEYCVTGEISSKDNNSKPVNHTYKTEIKSETQSFNCKRAGSLLFSRTHKY